MQQLGAGRDSSSKGGVQVHYNWGLEHVQGNAVFQDFSHGN